MAMPMKPLIPLLAAGMLTVSGTVQAQPMATANTGLSVSTMEPAAALKYFSEPAEDSGAVTFNIGDRFSGPGVITVGWLGSKKQVVLPPGEWVALAAVDHKSTGIRPTTLTSVVFGKFAGTRLGVAILAVVTSKFSEASHWNELDACEKPDPERLFQRAGSGNRGDRDCVEIKAFPSAFARSGTLADQLHASLDRMGATMSGTIVLSRLLFEQKRVGFMRVERIDWPAAVLGGEGRGVLDWKPQAVPGSGMHGAYVESLVDWVAAYQKVLARGFSRKIDRDDLEAVEPGIAVAPVSTAEFDPSRISAMVRE